MRKPCLRSENERSVPRTSCGFAWAAHKNSQSLVAVILGQLEGVHTASSSTASAFSSISSCLRCSMIHTFLSRFGGTAHILSTSL